MKILNKFIICLVVAFSCVAVVPTTAFANINYMPTGCEYVNGTADIKCNEGTLGFYTGQWWNYLLKRNNMTSTAAAVNYGLADQKLSQMISNYFGVNSGWDNSEDRMNDIMTTIGCGGKTFLLGGSCEFTPIKNNIEEYASYLLKNASNRNYYKNGTSGDTNNYSVTNNTNNNDYSSDSSYYFDNQNYVNTFINDVSYITNNTNLNYNISSYTYNVVNNTYNFTTDLSQNITYINNYNNTTIISPSGTTTLYYELPDGRSSYNLTEDEALNGYKTSLNVQNYSSIYDSDDLQFLYHFDGNEYDSAYPLKNYVLSAVPNSIDYIDSSNNAFGKSIAFSKDFTLAVSSSSNSNNLFYSFRIYPKIADNWELILNDTNIAKITSKIESTYDYQEWVQTVTSDQTIGATTTTSSSSSTTSVPEQSITSYNSANSRAPFVITGVSGSCGTYSGYGVSRYTASAGGNICVYTPNSTSSTTTTSKAYKTTTSETSTIKQGSQRITGTTSTTQRAYNIINKTVYEESYTELLNYNQWNFISINTNGDVYINGNSTGINIGATTSLKISVTGDSLTYIDEFAGFASDRSNISPMAPFDSNISYVLPSKTELIRYNSKVFTYNYLFASYSYELYALSSSKINKELSFEVDEVLGNNTSIPISSYGSLSFYTADYYFENGSFYGYSSDYEEVVELCSLSSFGRVETFRSLKSITDEDERTKYILIDGNGNEHSMSTAIINAPLYEKGYFSDYSNKTKIVLPSNYSFSDLTIENTYYAYQSDIVEVENTFDEETGEFNYRYYTFYNIGTLDFDFVFDYNYFDYDDFSSTDVPVEFKNAIKKSTSTYLNYASGTVLIQSLILVNDYKFGGTRPSNPTKGDVYFYVDENYLIQSCQQFNGIEWIELKAAVYNSYLDKWINIIGFSIKNNNWDIQENQYVSTSDDMNVLIRFLTTAFDNISNKLENILVAIRNISFEDNSETTINNNYDIDINANINDLIGDINSGDSDIDLNSGKYDLTNTDGLEELTALPTKVFSIYNDNGIGYMIFIPFIVMLVALIL